MATSKSAKRSHHIADEAGQLMEEAGEKSRAMAHRAVEAVRGSSHQLHDKASHAGDSVVKYIRRQPVKSVLIAAAAGATLMALVDLMLRSRRRD